MHTKRLLSRAWPLPLLLMGVSGCFNPFAPRLASSTGHYIPAPEPNSAEGVVRLFEWSYNHRDYSRYKELFTADYRFYFALGDSAGNTFRDAPVNREMEVTMAQHLFVGGGNASPANNISLLFDPTLRPSDDDRDGKNPRWHREIITNVNLTIKTDDNDWNIQGQARFYVVRGDSALIPDELGFGPDSTRWYIDRWNDETLQGQGAAAAQPASSRPTSATDLLDPITLSWGKLKAMYSR